MRGHRNTNAERRRQKWRESAGARGGRSGRKGRTLVLLLRPGLPHALFCRGTTKP